MNFPVEISIKCSNGIYDRKIQSQINERNSQTLFGFPLQQEDPFRYLQLSFCVWMTEAFSQIYFTTG